MTKRFFLKAFLQLLIPILLPIIILGLFAGELLNRYISTGINELHESKLRSYSLGVYSVMRELDQLTLQLSTNPAVTTRLKSVMAHADRGIRSDEYREFSAIIDMLFTSAVSNEYIDSMYLYYDVGGAFFLSSSNRISSLDHFADTAWYAAYQAMPAGQAEWVQLRSAPAAYAGASKLLTVYRRLHTNGTSQGVLVMNINLQRLTRLLDTLAEDMPLLLLDRDGTPLARNRLFAAAFGEAESALVAQAGASLEPGAVSRIRLSGTEYALQLYASDVFRWKVLCAIPIAELYRTSIALSRFMTVTLMAVTVISACIAYSLAKRNAKDLQNVIDAIDHAKRGLPVAEAAPKGDLYSYILQNIIETFLQKDYLALQLSERTYYNKVLELVALQSQLNPHFLFNTMETINWKTVALTGGPNEASAMIENLSDILHYALDTKDDSVPLSEEIQITNSYLAIQRIRYSDRFDFCLDCPPALMEVPVMKLLLQPLLENCIYHGIKQKKEKSHITVQISDLGTLIELCVKDDGAGMDAERLAYVQRRLRNAAQESSDHIGLYNTNKRIKLLYGEDYGLQIASRKNQGTVVSVRLPKAMSRPHDAPR